MSNSSIDGTLTARFPTSHEGTRMVHTPEQMVSELQAIHIDLAVLFWFMVPALLEGDVPFYSHEIEAYWNDIGYLEELRQGNLDALTGTVAIEPPARQISEGIYAGAGSDLDAVKVKAPVLIGENSQLGVGTDLHGPVVVGEDDTNSRGCRVAREI